MTDRVKVYRNLNRKCWSVLGKDGKLLFHAEALVLKDCQFIVQEGGRQRVIREGRKNVHAFVRGAIAPMASHQEFRSILKRVLYNPYECPTFTWEDGPKSVATEARCVLMNNDGRVYATPPQKGEQNENVS